MTSETPRFAGSYRIESVLGRGAMATVHLAHHTRIPDIQVAIKIVDNTHPEAEMLLARFEREAQILASVSHHHLVRIHDFGKIGRSFYIAMDYIRGCDLRDLINQHISSEQHFDPLLIIKILKEVCVALKVTHDRGIIHRDLKPENIMLEKTALDPYFVRVLDFGIAKMLDSVEDNPKRFQTMAGFVCGTAEYMSPEQAKGSPLDGRSDLYALGCLLYEMLSLQLPFSAENPVAYLTQHIAEPPFPLDIRAPNSNLYLRRLAHLLLSKNPDDRPDTALEVYEALMDIEDEIRVEDARKRSPRRNSKIMRIYTPPPTPAVTSLAGLASEVSIPVGIAVDEADPHHANTDEIRITTSPIQRLLVLLPPTRRD
jgi:eukaryotic-like serine/threonine-protein kinase